MKEKGPQNSEFHEDEIARYARHISLPEIGLNGQKLMKSSSVLCIGTGGLGSPVLLYLAAAGIGRIGIVDFDLVENSNLHRQIIHSSNSIGQPKVDSAKAKIMEINQYCKIDIYNTILRKSNALDIIRSYDVVCDCTDNFPSRFLINDACIILKKPNIYGSIAGFEGHATVFNLTDSSPNLRDLIPEPPPSELLPSCTEGGVLGVLPGIIGLIQATEVIKIITLNGNTLDGRLLIFNALSMKFKELKVQANNENKDIHQLNEYKGFCFNEDLQNQQKSIRSISVKDLKSLIKIKPKEIILIDVRNTNESELQSIGIAKSFPLKMIEDGSAINKIKEIIKGKVLYVHCKTGKRSLKAILKLKSYGITGINVSGGIDAWNKLIP